MAGKSLADGSGFERHRDTWPLHITLVPWFMPKNENSMISTINKLCDDYSTFSVEIGTVKLFGPNHDVEVNVLADQKEIRAFHDALLNCVIEQEAQLADEQHWIRGQYEAHITRHDGRAAAEGDMQRIDNISLVKYESQGNTCRVLKTLELQASS
ncbi:2'-5' RNA ligase family protein [Aeromicrobium sp.]|nr:2'-5' RNA ligase family protein [Candidatus Saccharibacteria bacterium]